MACASSSTSESNGNGTPQFAQMMNTGCGSSVVANLAAPDEATDVVAAAGRSRGRARAAARVTAPSLPPRRVDGALGHELQHPPGAAAHVAGTVATETVRAE